MPMPRRLTIIAALMSCALAAPVAAGDAGLDATEKRIAASVARHRDGALSLLRETVDIPSATENHAGVRKVGLGRGELGEPACIVVLARGDRGLRLRQGLAGPDDGVCGVLAW